MNVLRTIDEGGFPFKLDDLRFVFGQETYSNSGGLYNVLSKMLLTLGTDFIVYGCENLGAGICGEGLIMLNGQLLFVDEHTTTDVYFTKVTTYHADGLKTFQDASLHNTYEQNRGVGNALSGTLTWNTGLRYEQIVKTNLLNKNFTYEQKETIKGRIINFPNPTTITLTATKNVEIVSSLGNLYIIKSDASTYVELSTITESSIPSYVAGEEIFIKVHSASQPILINNTAGANKITTPTKSKVLAVAGTILKLQADADFNWKIMSSSIKLSDVVYVDMAAATTAVKLTTKVIEIGNWNMDTTDGLNVAHGLDQSKIRTVNVVIRNDSAQGSLSKSLDEGVNDLNTTRQGFYYINDSNILLKRLTGGLWDTDEFDEVSGYNRGWITITYQE